MGAKLSPVKKTISILLALLVMAPASAMGSGDKFSDSQTGLTSVSYTHLTLPTIYSV